MKSKAMVSGMRRAILILTVILGLSACGEPASPKGQPRAPPPTPMPVTRAPARPTGPGAVVPAVAPDALQEAASVSQFHAMPRLNAKVFSVSGGDPAANGLVTYLGLFGGPAEGWRVYPIGDFSAWRVVEAGPGKIVVAIRQDTAGPNGDIQNRTGHVHIAFDWRGETPPDAISVAITD